MSDVLKGIELKTDVNQSFVRCVDVMPRLVESEHLKCDEAITQAARVSYSGGTKTTSTDEGLIRYLMRHWHTSPFEMVEFKFHLKMPIFVARQWIRHRTASLNEISGRYSIVNDEFYSPEEARAQSKVNNQGSDGFVGNEETKQFLEYLDESTELYKKYQDSIDNGVSRELARIGLPVSLMTEFYWKIDLHNLYHFLRLRMDEHAQKEIRELACAIFEYVKKVCPISSQAFLDYRMKSVSLSQLEIEAIKEKKSPDSIKNKRERGEFIEKCKMLGLDYENSSL